MSPTRKQRRRGTSLVEAMVSFTLLTTAFSVALPLVVQHNRLLQSQRTYRLALDEVSNQLEALLVLSLDDIPAALDNLSVSEFTATRIRSARLTGEVTDVEHGARIRITMTWGGEVPRHVALAGWIPEERGNEEAGGAQR